MEITKEEYYQMINNQAVLSTLIRLIDDELQNSKGIRSAQDIYFEIRPLLSKLIQEEERIRNEY